VMRMEMIISLYGALDLLILTKSNWNLNKRHNTESVNSN
jgi:hypothetical protein